MLLGLGAARAEDIPELSRLLVHEPGPAAAYVQIYVKSSVLSRTPDLAISAHLMTNAEIDELMDDAIAELEEIRSDAKEALAAGASH